jgi:NHLM bacteriocin system ABC transporter ATP-binding protein
MNHRSRTAVVLAGEIFRSEGTLQEAGSDRPLLLAGDSVWWVEAGNLDVFAIRLDGGEPHGRRRHLFRVEAGRAVFPCDGTAEAGVGLLAVGTHGTRLRRLPRERAESLTRDAAIRPEISALVDEWVETASGAVSRAISPARCEELQPGSRVTLRARVSARPSSGVSWVRHEDGHSHFLGIEGLRMNGNGWIPLSHRSWMETAVASELELAPTRDVDAATLWHGLGLFHGLVLGSAARSVASAEAEEQARLSGREASESAVMEGACRLLVGALDGPASADAGLPAGPALAPESRGEALLACCRLVGSSQGITIAASERASGAQLAVALANIARSARFRTRTVMLRDGWWTADSGPLLAFSDEDKRPLALIPEGPGRYLVHDPVAGTRTPVDAAVAESIGGVAVTFYRSFPVRALNLWDVLRFASRGSHRDLAMLGMMGAVVGMLGLVTPIATGVIFNTVIPGADRGQLLQLVLVLVVTALSAAVFNLIRSLAQIRIEGRVGAVVQAAVWDRLLSLPLSFFRPYSAGELAVRAMGIDAIRQTLSGATTTALLGGIFSLANLLLLFRYSTRLALWATGLVAVAVTATLLISWMQLRYQRQISALQQEISGSVLQFLGSIAKLHVSGAEPHAFAVWAGKFSEQRKYQYRARRIGNTLTAFNTAYPVVCSTVIFAVAAPLLRQGELLRTGDFLAFISSFTLFLTAMLSMSTAFVSVLAVVPLYENARPILETVPEVDEAKTHPGVLSGDIEATHLAFRYQADGPLVLRDLSFHIRAGEFVAFVGPSGTGKSTIFRLLLGFDRPEGGAVYFDGQEIAGLDIQAVRQQVGVVLQNGRLMPGDVFTNIVGSSPATQQDAWEAARMAGLDEDIRQMPMGMHTVINEGGSTLSGGQRQRLMIARAIVNRPRILLFDEATSALDNRTQTIVSQSLERLNATRIVIAHRLSTVVNADRILVFEGGRIVESGNYAELMAQGGRFAEMAERQLM